MDQSENNISMADGINGSQLSWITEPLHADGFWRRTLVAYLGVMSTQEEVDNNAANGVDRGQRRRMKYCENTPSAASPRLVLNITRLISPRVARYWS